MNNKLSTNEIRKKWLDFFKSKNHLEVESKSLIPVNDNSLLWINSGVATLKKFFSGQENPPSNRLVNSQKCIRTNDVENVGLTSRHHTFFEMLGNFSIGDYFRKEAIAFAAEFLLKVLNINPKLLYVTVYEEDQESYDLWIKHGIIKEHIVKCDKSRNFWEIGAGPCGPCTEIYYDRGEKFDPDHVGEKLFFEDIENDRYIEIWNIVFSEFENDGKNNYKKLVRQNIDTGAGLERLACILQNANTNYDTDGFTIPRKELEKFSTYKYDENLYFEKNKNEVKVFINKSFVVIIDHIKACLFAIADGALPSNKDRGYILRKLLRRSFFYMDFLKIKKEGLNDLLSKLIEINLDYYPYLKNAQNHVFNTISKEYDSYKVAIKNSMKFLFELLELKKFDEQNLFKLVDTYGFPIEIINELEQSKHNELKQMMFACLSDDSEKMDLGNLNFDFKKFTQYFNNHRKISKSNKSVNGIDKQNNALMELNVTSVFDYEKEEISDAKVIKLFDDDFNEVESLTNENGYLVLDKTVVYATSGGQVNDTGWVNQIFIDNAIKAPSGVHVHHVVNATLKLNEIVKITIDKIRRQKNRIHHSSEHLLHSALKNEISHSIKQEGALKNPDKFTFDFYYPKKLTIEEIIKIENNVKNVIARKIDSLTQLCTLEEAQKIGALAYFEDVYKKIKGKLRVVTLSDKSTEICGGTHVKNTSEIYDFKIINLTSKGSGSWRIEAISGKDNIDNFKITTLQNAINQFNEYKKVIESEKNIDENIKNILSKNLNETHYLEIKNDLDELKVAATIIKNKNQKNLMQKEANELKSKLIKDVNKFFDEVIYLENIDRKTLMASLTDLVNEIQSKFFVLINGIDGSYQYLIACNETLAKQKNINANVLAKELNASFSGKGGGRNNFVQGNLKNIDKNQIEKIVGDYINAIK